MSYTQFGYSSYAASSPLVIGGSSGQNTCYERTGVSPESQYDARLYPRLPSYTTSYQADPNLDPTTTFYAPALNSSYGMKESPDPWRSISSSASYYYDPTLAAYGYGGLDFNGARRKNVTRDSTSTLKAWLNEHRKNPYPTKGEKIMLAIITKMTLTQVSTWFANARRRLKKENKMTWEPRNKAESHDDDSGKERDTDKETDAEQPAQGFREESCGEKADPLRGMQGSASSMADGTDMELSAHHHRSDPFCSPVGSNPQQQQQQLHPQQQHFEDSSHPELLSATSSTTNSGYTPSVSSQSSSPDIEAYHMHHSHHRPGKESGPSSCFGEPHHHLYKPKIWSLADTATNKAVETALMPYVHQDLCSPSSGTWLGGSGTSKGYENCSSSSLSFQRFGGYNCSLHSFNPISLQTDTPPQTPPNMKVGATAHQGAAPVPSSAYMEGAAYAMGQASALCPTADGMPDVQMQDDKMDDFSNSHSSGLPQTSTSNQNLNSDCIADDYDDPSQYSGQAVR